MIEEITVMDIVFGVAGTVLDQLQKPTLAFLIAGMVLAAFGSKLTVPDQVQKFIALVLLLKVGLGAGIPVRNADFVELAVPAFGATVLGILIVLFWKSDACADVGCFEGRCLCHCRPLWSGVRINSGRGYGDPQS
jgi:hypothetical protein